MSSRRVSRADRTFRMRLSTRSGGLAITCNVCGSSWWVFTLIDQVANRVWARAMGHECSADPS